MSTSGGYVFSFDNGTGTFVNDSWIAFSANPDWSNVTKTVNSTLGATIRWCVYANDTSDNWNSTSCVSPFSYVTTEAADILSPTYSDNSTNTTRPGKNTLFSLKWADGIGLDSYIFSFHNGSNLTGTEYHLVDFETFESNYGDWDYDNGDAGCDWLRDEDGTPSSNTGPQPQGTAPGASGTDWYVFIESSSGQCDHGEQAYLLLNTIIDLDNYPDTGLSFYYSMYGANIGTLNVQLNTPKLINLLLTINHF